MVDAQDRHRIGQARLLRRQGKTYDEIRAILGPVGEDRLRQWLKGIPRPPETWRAKAKDDVRRECRRLRALGLTHDDIAEITGASSASISGWVRDMPREFPGAAERRLRRLQATCARKRAERAKIRAAQIDVAASTVGMVTDRELFLVGLTLYWAEGGKSKPWAIRDHITFVNSDPDVIVVFLGWLDLLGVDRCRLRFHVSIHDTADIPAAEGYWSDLAGVPVETFNRTSVKRHNPKTTRYNTGAAYRGCLIVDVLQSADLYRRVEGWWQGLVLGVAPRVEGS
jgi:hypothetical protein